MMDSGASLHSADLEKHIEGRELVLTGESRRGDFAYTAKGDKLNNLGRCNVNGMCDGVKITIGGSGIKVDVLAASVRTVVRK